MAKKTGEEIVISRPPSAQSYILNGEEEKRLSAFPDNRAMPADLEGHIERYITKKTRKDWTDPVITDVSRKAIVAQKG